MATMTRKSVPLDALVEEAMERVRRHDSPENAALRQVTGISVSDDTSDAEVLRALLNAGRVAVQEKALENGYAALAAAQDDEDRAYAAARRARRRNGTGADE
ncbi:hypothetical protein HHL19_34165 [Streptomyces sp. R302]|uniref:hypothetical protein n=1 Tax=unclassified Streptomyces TaxID=2593676 RepID=UPI00145EF276|nr:MULTISPECIES: hypothetical protein [unclassified Streptomyces]NML54870.1 hypothetical protein [Streptomyces sp. R301]NML83557.1 hypothetical protein [Streptomyces sp. R302]